MKILNESLLNISTEYFVDVQKILVSVNVNFPEDKSDKNFRREFFRTSIDGEKVFKGLYGNFVLRTFMENYLKSVGQKTVFPVKKVREVKGNGMKL